MKAKASSFVLWNTNEKQEKPKDRYLNFATLPYHV